MPEPKKKSDFAMAREGKVGKISIIGPIGWDYWGMSYKGFKKALDDLGDINLIEVEINSPGGIVTDGNAMVNALREHPATVHTYNMGEAASMGSVLLLAGDRVFVPDNSMTFIHKPLTIAIGNAEDMRDTADALDKFEKAIASVYQKHFKGSKEELTDLLAEEAWWNADEIADKFNNVSVIETGEMEAAAHGEPMEILGDLVQFEETILDRAVNAVRNRVAGTTKEVDMPMTPEEKQEIVESTTASVIEALNQRDEAKATAEAEAQAAASAEAEDKIEIEFEGDQDNPEDVKAHQEKLEKAQLKAAVDWNDPESVAAYHKAISGKEEALAKPGTNATASESATGKGASDEHSEDEIQAAIDSMTGK